MSHSYNTQPDRLVVRPITFKAQEYEVGKESRWVPTKDEVRALAMPLDYFHDGTEPFRSVLKTYQNLVRAFAETDKELRLGTLSGEDDDEDVVFPGMALSVESRDSASSEGSVCWAILHAVEGEAEF